MINYNAIVVFDFETTGLNPKKDEIIEVAAIRYEKDSTNNFSEVSRVSSLIKVRLPLPDIIVKITNITDEMITRDGKSFTLVLNQLLDLIEDDALLVGYNVNFDLGFLIESIKREGILFDIKNDILDVMAVYKDYYQYPHKLDSVVQTFNITHPNTHRATDDVIATFLGLVELSKVVKDLNKYINVIGYNSKYPLNRLPLTQLKYVPQKGGGREIEKL